MLRGGLTSPEHIHERPREMTEEVLVHMSGISKRFPGVLANDNVDFSLKAGEIHALLGENGAGKTTLMSVLAGVYWPNAGTISIQGRKVSIQSPRQAIQQGIGMVHQHFMLVPSYSVAENITLGLDKPKFFLRKPDLEKEIILIAQRFGVQVDPQAKIWQLSVGEQQRVEIMKMLYRGARILILDEPTAVLTPQEVDELFSTLRQMAHSGHGIVFISHKLDEVMRIADRISVMRKGRRIATVLKSETNSEQLARMMVGREVLFNLEKKECQRGEKILRLEGVRSLSDKGLPALKDLSLEVCAGEILGIAGVAGNGQRELAEVVNGLRPLTGGKIFIEGRDVSRAKPREIIDQGVAFIPEDRKGMGIVSNLDLADNLILKSYRRSPHSNGFFLRSRVIREETARLVKDFEIAAPNLETPAKLLSGGNAQRLILAREISGRPKLIIAVHPTRGLDVGATESVRKIILEQREAGAAILLISEDLEELLFLSDRLAVLYEGQVMGIMDPQEVAVEEVGLLMAGRRAEVKTA